MDVVTCPSCREENPARFRLCGFCGASLAPAPETVVCPSCGEENPGRFRLCGFCGTTLQGAGTPATYSLDAFRLAFLTQVPLWLLGMTFIIVERKRTRIRMGLDQERRPRSR